MESEPMLTPRKKSPLLGKKSSSEEDQTHDAASRRTASPTHYQPNYSGATTRPVTSRASLSQETNHKKSKCESDERKTNNQPTKKREREKKKTQTNKRQQQQQINKASSANPNISCTKTEWLAMWLNHGDKTLFVINETSLTARLCSQFRVIHPGYAQHPQKLQGLPTSRKTYALL